MPNKIDPAPPRTNKRYNDWPEINQYLKGIFQDENNEELTMILSKNTLIPPVKEVKEEILMAGYDIYDENDSLFYIRLK